MKRSLSNQRREGSFISKLATARRIRMYSMFVFKDRIDLKLGYPSSQSPTHA